MRLISSFIMMLLSQDEPIYKKMSHILQPWCCSVMSNSWDQYFDSFWVGEDAWPGSVPNVVIESKVKHIIYVYDQIKPTILSSKYCLQSLLCDILDELTVTGWLWKKLLLAFHFHYDICLNQLWHMLHHVIMW